MPVSIVRLVAREVHTHFPTGRCGHAVNCRSLITPSGYTFSRCFIQKRESGASYKFHGSINLVIHANANANHSNSLLVQSRSPCWVVILATFRHLDGPSV